MRASILKQSKFLIASVQGSMTDADLVQLREELGAGVRRHRSTGVIVDVAMLDVMDSFAVRTLRGIAQMVKLWELNASSSAFSQTSHFRWCNSVSPWRGPRRPSTWKTG